MPNNRLKYALVTPARNEQDYIGYTLASVVAQTALPEKWVIVSDGSTDRTDAIVKEYADAHPWIELLRMPERRDRQFAAKAHAFNAGCARLEGVAYDIIGNLDADISFDSEYFEFILDKFAADAKLGCVARPGAKTRMTGASTPTTIVSPNWNMFRGPVKCSAKSASRKSAATFQSKAARLIGWR